MLCGALVWKQYQLINETELYVYIYMYICYMYFDRATNASFQILTNSSSYHSTLYSLATDSFVK
jgi:hypothetical protein